MAHRFYSLMTAILLVVSCNNFSFGPITSDPPQEERPNQPTEEETSTEEVSATWENDLLAMVNQLRQEGCRCGRKRMAPVGPLRLSSKLNKAAQVHANDMERNQFFNHKGTDGSQVSDRATRVGYRWSNIGENISWNYPGVKATFEGWKKSKGHCENMMSPDFKEMGAARSGAYWVQTLGTAR